MYNFVIAEPKGQENPLEDLIKKARFYRRSRFSFTESLDVVQSELRKRRKSFLGSSVPLTDIVWKDGALDREAVSILVAYLAERTVFLWKDPYDNAEQFCQQFYEMGIIAIADIYLSEQCLDDIIRLANSLVHDGKSVVSIVMTDLLPRTYHDMLSTFLASFNGEYCIPSFEDAVLGAVSILLGVLADPLPEREED